MKRISVYGYDGSLDELKQELSFGLAVEKVTAIPSGKGGMYVDYEEKRKGGKPPKLDKDRIKELRAAGLSYQEVAKVVGCSKTYVIAVCRE